MSETSQMVIDAMVIPGTQRDTLLPCDMLLHQMDRAGIAQAVVSPEDRELAVDWEGGNRRIAGIAVKHPRRLIPACSANPWAGEAAVQSLLRAMDSGARMLVLSPAVQGFCIGDEVADPVMDLSASRRLPVYVHTGSHAFAAPTQLALLAKRRPDVRFILGHCGSTDFISDLPAIFAMKLPNLWFELSFIRPFAVQTLFQTADMSKLIYGSSAPRNDPVFELRQFDAVLPMHSHPQIYGGTIARLLSEVC